MGINERNTDMTANKPTYPDFFFISFFIISGGVSNNKFSD